MSESCEILLTTEQGQILAGRVLLGDDGELRYSALKDYKILMKTVMHTRPIVGSKRFDPEKDPSAWLRSLAYHYNGSYIKAKVSNHLFREYGVKGMKWGVRNKGQQRVLASVPRDHLAGAKVKTGTVVRGDKSGSGYDPNTHEILLTPTASMHDTFHEIGEHIWETKLSDKQRSWWNDSPGSIRGNMPVFGYSNPSPREQFADSYAHLMKGTKGAYEGNKSRQLLAIDNVKKLLKGASLSLPSKESLQEYGIKGMKWGQRKGKSEDKGSPQKVKLALTAADRQDLRYGMAKLTTVKLSSVVGAPHQQMRIYPPTIEKYHQLITSGKGISPVMVYPSKKYAGKFRIYDGTHRLVALKRVLGSGSSFPVLVMTKKGFNKIVRDNPHLTGRKRADILKAAAAFREFGVKGMKWGVRKRREPEGKNGSRDSSEKPVPLKGKPHVTILMGINGSGKSTLLKNFVKKYGTEEVEVDGEKWNVVSDGKNKALMMGNYSTDEHTNGGRYFIRGNFWQKFKAAMHAAKELGIQNVIVEAKRLAYGKQHEKMVKITEKNGVSLHAVRVYAPPDVASERVAQRKERAHISKRSPEELGRQDKRVGKAFERVSNRLTLTNDAKTDLSKEADKLGSFVFKSSRKEKLAASLREFGVKGMKWRQRKEDKDRPYFDMNKLESLKVRLHSVLQADTGDDPAVRLKLDQISALVRQGEKISGKRRGALLDKASRLLGRVGAWKESQTRESVRSISIDRLKPTQKLGYKRKQGIPKLKKLVKQGKGTGKKPIKVRKRDDGKFDILDGHHRFIAHKAVGRKAIPARVVESGYSSTSRWEDA